VLHRILLEDQEHRVLRLRIRDVPAGVGQRETQTALERAGRTFGDGAFLWGNHSILPQDAWQELERAAAETISYADLLDEAKGEKRITLRLPVGLHAAAVKAAGGKSFNQFCADILADAVGYREEELAPYVPRLAARFGKTEEAIADITQRAVDRARAYPTGREDTMAELFGGISQLPAEQQKAQLLAGLSSHADAIRAAHEHLATADDDVIAAMAPRSGKTPEELRAFFAQMASTGLAQERERLAAADPEDIKATYLQLREIFRGATDGGDSLPEDRAA
jgi:hypothetical protein